MAEPSGAMINVATMPKETVMKAIVDEDAKLADKRGKDRVIREQLRDLIDQLPEAKAVDEARGALAAAKTALNQAITRSPEIEALFEKLNDSKHDISVQENLVSGMLVLYAAQHKTKSIEMDDGEMHIIKISAKIGRKLKEQLELPLG